MDIRVMKYFVTVAKEENIMRAAESLHITQPSLSKQLIELENELGRQLLIRGKRRITLTDDGNLLLKRAEEIIALFDKTQQELSCNADNVTGKISIGGMITEEIVAAASGLRKKYSDITFDFYSGNAFELIRSGFGYLLTSRDHLPKELDKDLCFKKLNPKLELNYALVWKRNAVLLKAPQAFLREIKQGI